MYDGRPHGIAASSFTTVSLEPPRLVSVCVAHTSSTWPLLSGLRRLGLSVLAGAQGTVAKNLAAKSEDRFTDIDWVATEQGAVFVHGSTLWLDCEPYKQVVAGDHDIVVLKVAALAMYPDVAPMVFHRSVPRSRCRDTMIEARCGSPMTRTIEPALKDLRRGRAVVLVDDIAPVHTGCLIFAAELATPDLVAFTVRHTSGYLYVTLNDSVADWLDLPSLPSVNRNANHNTYAVFGRCERRDDITGISASDRARTLRVMAEPVSTRSGPTRPGHVVPVRIPVDGVLERPGLAEAAHDLVALSGLRAAAAAAEIVSVEDATRMADRSELEQFAHWASLALVSVHDVLTARLGRSIVANRLERLLIGWRSGALVLRHVR